jgi:N-acyl-D-aspartate/D-glutamate deacylase
MFDLILRGATVYDGTGSPGKTADVAVRGGRIAEVGRVGGAARATVDADGLALMPGIVDLHTHYDAQITWDPTLSPSPSLGVTTAILGNCGFGIAPCPRHLRETMLQNLSVVEGMDLDVLAAGTRWDFESFPEYLELLRQVQPAINVGVLAQHSTIRTAVMGGEASTRREPTGEQLARMQAIVREALAAGAAGFASSFSPNHSGYAGLPMPSTIAEDAELRALVGTLGEAGRGVFTMATGPRATPEFMESLVAATGRPAFISTVLTMYSDAEPKRGMEYYERCAAALARGREVYIQTTCQPLSFDFTLRDPYLLLSHDAFDRVKTAQPDELRAIYADPAFRQRLRENLAHPQAGILFYGNWATIEVAAAGPAHRDAEGRSVAVLAREAGKDPLDFFFDFALATGLEAGFVGKLYQNDDAGVAPLLRHPAGVIALSDAGAHLIFMCDAGFGLYFLKHWVRETGTFTLEEGVRRLTGHPASLYRIPERGRIEPGMWADLLLFDPQAIGLTGLERVGDLPGGRSRMTRRPQGVAGVWVNGAKVFDGRDGMLPVAGPGHVLTSFHA